MNRKSTNNIDIHNGNITKFDNNKSSSRNIKNIDIYKYNTNNIENNNNTNNTRNTRNNTRTKILLIGIQFMINSIV